MAAFARLTRPKTPAGFVNPDSCENREASSSRPALSKEQREEAFARLTRPRPATAASKTAPEGQDEKLATSKRFSGQPTVISHFNLSVSNRKPLEAAVQPPSKPKVLGSRETNIQCLPFDGKTVPKPFCLKSLDLHESAKARLSERIRAEEIELAKRRSFKATSLSVELLDGPTFVPKLEPASEVCTVPQLFSGYSGIRAERRATFDEENQERIAREEREKKQADAARIAAERKAAKENWRKNAFRARPVPDFVAITQAAEEAALSAPQFEPTSPHTPFLATRLRFRVSDSVMERNQDSQIAMTSSMDDSISLALESPSAAVSSNGGYE